MQAKVNGEQHAAKMKHILKTLVELLYPHELFILNYQAIPMTNEHCIVVETCIVCIRLAVMKVILKVAKLILLTYLLHWNISYQKVLDEQRFYTMENTCITISYCTSITSITQVCGGDIVGFWLTLDVSHIICNQLKL